MLNIEQNLGGHIMPSYTCQLQQETQPLGTAATGTLVDGTTNKRVVICQGSPANNLLTGASSFRMLKHLTKCTGHNVVVKASRITEDNDTIYIDTENQTDKVLVQI